jgi:hypothetical protein
VTTERAGFAIRALGGCRYTRRDGVVNRRRMTGRHARSAGVPVDVVARYPSAWVASSATRTP